MLCSPEWEEIDSILREFGETVVSKGTATANIDWTQQRSVRYSMRIQILIKEALKKLAGDGQARRNQMKKLSLQNVNEHFESDFNTA